MLELLKAWPCPRLPQHVLFQGAHAHICNFMTHTFFYFQSRFFLSHDAEGQLAAHLPSLPVVHSCLKLNMSTTSFISPPSLLLTPHPPNTCFSTIMNNPAPCQLARQEVDGICPRFSCPFAFLCHLLRILYPKQHSSSSCHH